MHPLNPAEAEKRWSEFRAKKLKPASERYLMFIEHEKRRGRDSVSLSDEEIASVPFCFGVDYADCNKVQLCPVGEICGRCNTELKLEISSQRPLFIDLFLLNPPIRLIRSWYMAEFGKKVMKDEKYKNKEVILIEQNILKAPIVQAKLQELIYGIKRKRPFVDIAIIEMLEPPWLLELAFENFNPEKGETDMELYKGGDIDLDDKGRQVRSRLNSIAERIKALETLRESISVDEYQRISKGIQRELAVIRREEEETIVYNQPEEWLRTAANDADMLLQYLIEKEKYPFWGFFIYSDVDMNFVQYISKNWDAISTLSGNIIQIFALEAKEHLLDDQKVFIHQLAIHRSKVVRDISNGIVAHNDKLNLEEEQHRIMSHVFSRNDSLAFAERLGIPRNNTPCLVIWKEMESREFIQYSFQDTWASTGELTEHIKSILDILSKEHKTDSLEGVEKELSKLRTQKFIKRTITNQSIGTIFNVVAKGISLL